MAPSPPLALFFFFFSLAIHSPLILVSALACRWCPLHANATLSPLPAPSTLRGYAAVEMQQLGAAQYAAAASIRFFRTAGGGGGGGGSCFQLRCTDDRLCSPGGARVALTDVRHSSDAADLGLPREAFLAMARHAARRELLERRTVSVEYRRVPCEYANKNLSIRVEETSRHPSALAFKFIYQGGQTDIGAVDIAPVGSSARWQYMSRQSGSAAWSTAAAPAGPLQLRIVVTAGAGGKWVRAEQAVLPRDWEAGSVYDTGLQLSDVALGTCLSCLRRRQQR